MNLLTTRPSRRWAHIPGTLAALGLLLAATASETRAQLVFSLTPVSPTTAPNSTLSFTALLTNGNGAGAEIVDLLGASGNLTGTGNTDLAIDDATFLNSLPLSLAPGEQYSESIFVVVGVNASPGLYTFAYTVDGQEQTSGNAVSASSSPTFTVQAASAAAPEPSALALLLPGIVGLASLRRRRPIRKNCKKFGTSKLSLKGK